MRGLLTPSTHCTCELLDVSRAADKPEVVGSNPGAGGYFFTVVDFDFFVFSTTVSTEVLTNY